MSDPISLLESTSPNENITAVVEADGRTVYFYLYADEKGEGGLPFVWVRNLVTAPPQPDVEGMRQCFAPLLHRDACSHPTGLPLPSPEDLSVVWFEEGDGAALLERDSVIAVVPAWSGYNGFQGYARDCTAETEFAWPLSGALEVMAERVVKAAEFWSSWESGDPWTGFRDNMLSAYESVLGKHQKYYAADGGTWPPRAIVLFDYQDATVMATIGMSLRPQPEVELVAANPSILRRVELAVAFEKSVSAEAMQEFASWISGQITYPWKFRTWLGDGHTMPCSVASHFVHEGAAVLFLAQAPGAPAISLPETRNDPVSLLWLLPVSAGERDFAMRESGSDLATLLTQAGVTWKAQIHRATV